MRFPEMLKIQKTPENDARRNVDDRRAQQIKIDRNFLRFTITRAGVFQRLRALAHVDLRSMCNRIDDPPRHPSRQALRCRRRRRDIKEQKNKKRNISRRNHDDLTEIELKFKIVNWKKD
jgi:hypothetical protein